MKRSTMPDAGPRAAMAALAIAVALGAFGCGDDEATTTAGEEQATDAAGVTGATGDSGEQAVSNLIDVSETEYAMTPANASVESLIPGETTSSTAKAGEVTFEVTNDGEETHTFVFNKAGKEIPIGEVLEPGESAEMTVDVDLGFYEYYCPIGDHQKLGMQAELEVIE